MWPGFIPLMSNHDMNANDQPLAHQPRVRLQGRSELCTLTGTVRWLLHRTYLGVGEGRSQQAPRGAAHPRVTVQQQAANDQPQRLDVCAGRPANLRRHLRAGCTSCCCKR